MAICLLCNEEKKLLKSHIIPKFFIDWVKKTSLTGKLRSSTNPNIRQQDGEKRELLCHDCEQLFSRKEKYFSENIFKKIINNNLKEGKVVEKEDIYFCVSIIWRCFSIVKDTINTEELSEVENKRIVDFLESCRKYLLEEENEINYNFYLIPTNDEMYEKNKIYGDKFLNERGTDISDHEVFSREEEGYDYHRFYVKIPFFIIRADLCSNEMYNEKGCLLKIGEKILEFDEISLSKDIEKYYDRMITRNRKMSNEISQCQKNKTMEEALKNILSR